MMPVIYTLKKKYYRYIKNLDGAQYGKKALDSPVFSKKRDSDTTLEQMKGGGMNTTTEKISIEIVQLKKAVQVLEKLTNDFPTLACNLRRIAACVKMLEINFVDPEKYGRPADAYPLLK